MFSYRFVACSLFFLLSSLPLHAAEALLVWKFRVGDQHTYRMTQQMEMEMALGAAGRQVKTQTSQVLDTTWEIVKVDDQGVATITQTVDRVQMDMQTPGQPKLHYDSDSKEPPSGYAAMLASLFKAMMAEPLTMTFSPRGEIKTLKIPATFSKAMQKIPGAKLMGEMASEEGFKSMMQRSSLILPQSANLNPGYEWSQQVEMANLLLGKISTEDNYRYVGLRKVGEQPYHVFSREIETNFGGLANGEQIEIVKQESKGEILFDGEAGRLESSKLEQKVELKLSADEQSTVQVVQQVTSERVEKKKESKQSQKSAIK